MKKKRGVENKLATFFKDQRDIIAVYLFGSYAAHKFTDDSDIDVAILLKKGINRNKAADLALDFTCGLMRFLKKNKIDVLILNFANPIVKHQVYLKGKLVYCRDKIQTLRYNSFSSSEYLDFLPFRLKAEESSIRKINKGRLYG